MIPLDKQLHFAGGAFIALLAAVHTGDWRLGLAAGAFAGGLKELLDELQYGGADLRDFLVTCLGALAGSAIQAAYVSVH